MSTNFKYRQGSLPSTATFPASRGSPPGPGPAGRGPGGRGKPVKTARERRPS